MIATNVYRENSNTNYCYFHYQGHVHLYIYCIIIIIIAIIIIIIIIIYPSVGVIVIAFLILIIINVIVFIICTHLVKEHPFAAVTPSRCSNLTPTFDPPTYPAMWHSCTLTHGNQAQAGAVFCSTIVNWFRLDSIPSNASTRIIIVTPTMNERCAHTIRSSAFHVTTAHSSPRQHRATRDYQIEL